MERWLHIRGYEKEYMVSDHGRVKSLERTTSRPSGTYIHKEKILKPGGNGKGYLQVSLYKSGKNKSFKIHRLVAEHFLLRDSKTLEVNHMDFNKANNHYTNLEWITRRGNMEHTIGKPHGGSYKGKYIQKAGNKYALVIKFIKYYKSFLTLEEAMKKKEELLNEYLRKNTSCK